MTIPAAVPNGPRVECFLADPGTSPRFSEREVELSCLHAANKGIPFAGAKGQLASVAVFGVADADQPGVRIATPRGDASDLRLSRMLKRAELIRADTIPATFDLLRAGQADVLAGVRPGLLERSARMPGYRVLEDRFGVILVAALVPKGQAGRLAYISEFIEQAKASGLVQQTIERAGLRGVQVAPPGNPSSQ